MSYYSKFPNLIAQSKADKYFSAMSAQLPSGKKAVIRTFFDSLEASGIWGKLEYLNIFALETEQQALVNAINPTQSLIKSGSPVFTGDDGFRCNSNLANYLSTPNNANSFLNYGQNDASFSTWVTIPAGINSSVMGIANSCALFPSSTGGGAGVYTRVNTSTTWSFVTTAKTPEFVLAARNGASTAYGYRDGATAADHTQTSTAVPPSPFRYLSVETAANNMTMRFAHIGKFLTKTEASNLYGYVNTLLSGLDAL